MKVIEMQQEQAEKQKQQICVPQLAASKRFGQYKKEEKKAVRERDVRNQTLESMKAVWEGFEISRGIESTLISNQSTNSILSSYNCAFKIVKKHNYSSAEVEKFCIALSRYQYEPDFSIKAGLFLSALINTGKDMHYKLFTSHLDIKIDYLGFNNSKNIEVTGDVGNEPAFGMSGRMVVNGNAGECVGRSMNGGELHINGDYISLAYVWVRFGRIDRGFQTAVYHGKVYHNGKLIYPGA